MIKYLISIGLLMSTALMTCTLASDAPSFDCAKANTAVERTICGNSNLKHLDRVMALAYRALSKQETIKKAQLAWLKSRPSLQQPLFDSYKNRLDQLVSNEANRRVLFDYVMENFSNDPDKNGLLAVLLAYMIDRAYIGTEVIEKPEMHFDRLSSQVYKLSDHKLLVLYSHARAAYSVNYQVFVIGKQSDHLAVQKVKFTQYESKTKSFVPLDDLGLLTFDPDKKQISILNKGAGYGGYSREYLFELSQENPVLIQQKATQDNFDPDYKITGEDKDWVIEYQKK